MEELVKYLKRLAGRRFFGRVVLSFQNGKVCEVKLEQTLKMYEIEAAV